MIYISSYLERWKFIVLCCIVGSFLFVGIFLFSNLLILQGAVKERSEKECVSSTAIKNWEETLETAKTICIEAPNIYSSKIKESHDAQIKELERQVKYWKDSYFWLKNKK